MLHADRDVAIFHVVVIENVLFSLSDQDPAAGAHHLSRRGASVNRERLIALMTDEVFAKCFGWRDNPLAVFLRRPS